MKKAIQRQSTLPQQATSAAVSEMQRQLLDRRQQRPSLTCPATMKALLTGSIHAGVNAIEAITTVAETHSNAKPTPIASGGRPNPPPSTDSAAGPTSVGAPTVSSTVDAASNATKHLDAAPGASPTVANTMKVTDTAAAKLGAFDPSARPNAVAAFHSPSTTDAESFATAADSTRSDAATPPLMSKSSVTSPTVDEHAIDSRDIGCGALASDPTSARARSATAAGNRVRCTGMTMTELTARVAIMLS